MAPKKSVETFIVELREFCENGFYPRETPGSAGYRLIKCIRKARRLEVFTADQLAEIDRMEGRYGMSTQSVRVSTDASALMNDLRHFYPRFHLFLSLSLSVCPRFHIFLSLSLSFDLQVCRLYLFFFF